MNTFCARLIARIYHLWNKWTGGNRRLLYGILGSSSRIETLSWYICNNLTLQIYGRCEFFSCFSKTNQKQRTKNSKDNRSKISLPKWTVPNYFLKFCQPIIKKILFWHFDIRKEGNIYNFSIFSINIHFWNFNPAYLLISNDYNNFEPFLNVLRIFWTLFLSKYY